LVEVYISGQPVRKLDLDGVLEGGDMLPGFSVAGRDIFQS
jgi:hypothetical protein